MVESEKGKFCCPALRFLAFCVNFGNLLLKISDARKKIKMLKRPKAKRMKRNKEMGHNESGRI